MAKFTATKAGGVPLKVLVGAGIAKPFTEAALTPIVGDGNLISGVTKTLGGVAVNQYGGRGLVQDSVSIALVVDGMEDIMRGVFGMGSGTSDAFGGAI